MKPIRIHRPEKILRDRRNARNRGIGQLMRIRIAGIYETGECASQSKIPENLRPIVCQPAIPLTGRVVSGFSADVDLFAAMLSGRDRVFALIALLRS